MDIPSGKIFVFDTSSIIKVKHLVRGQSNQQTVFDELTQLCEHEGLTYPPKVLVELEQYPEQNADLPLIWARKNKEKGCKFGNCFEEVKKVMNDSVAQLIIDTSKPFNRQEADPYVLATALIVEAELLGDPVVVTEEAKKSPPEVPLNVAAGALNLPSINLYALLVKTNIWSSDFERY
ncbi:MAG: DUF4411 family protein [Gammaproteobacteria bacterium]|nr:DUF4411 family protein [Gammaproteobacteria bacterium]MDE0252718.1 DUF4411 family protein [Gammaproteobacteria bacterium]MDE0402406.1 DUF4411 family protein [Gammaproteobacteria bacterium]